MFPNFCHHVDELLRVICEVYIKTDTDTYTHHKSEEMNYLGDLLEGAE